MRKLLLVVFCLLLSGKYFGQDVPQSERDALVAFYDSFGGDYWVNKTNWKTAQPVSTWYGVTVDYTAPGTPHVTNISFYSNGLFGEIPSEIKNLTYLQTLSLQGDAITKVSGEIGTLSNLVNLTLTGPISSGGTKFLTTLPETIGNLTHLQKLDLSINALTALPSTLSNLTNLKELNITSNEFTSFPEIITSITSLERFRCSGNNKISGGIVPISFGNLINLNYLFFAESNIKITDPEIFSKMSKLNYIYLGSMLTPAYIDLGNNTLLSYVDIENSQIQIVNLKNGNNAALPSSIYGSSTLGWGYNSTLKCVAVDNPSRAAAGIAPYQNITFRFINNVKNFQTDCSAYISALGTADIKSADLKIVNPVNDLLIVQSPQKIIGIEIYDSTGRLVKTFKTSGGIVSDLAKGIYIVKITTDSGTTTQKIIKE